MANAPSQFKFPNFCQTSLSLTSAIGLNFNVSDFHLIETSGGYVLIQEASELFLLQLIFRACQVESNGVGRAAESPGCNGYRVGCWAET